MTTGRVEGAGLAAVQREHADGAGVADDEREGEDAGVGRGAGRRLAEQRPPVERLVRQVRDQDRAAVAVGLDDRPVAEGELHVLDGHDVVVGGEHDVAVLRGGQDGRGDPVHAEVVHRAQAQELGQGPSLLPAGQHVREQPDHPLVVRHCRLPARGASGRLCRAARWPHPSIVPPGPGRWRTDAPPGQTPPMASPAEILDVDGTPVRLTSGDRVVFPALGEAGGTKRHLAEYYRTVATDPSGAVLTALRDRPTHLQRFPDGVDGDEVYQKRLPKGAPDWVQTCGVRFPSGRSADVLRVTSAADVVWAAQMSTVTFHPWHTRCDDTDHPDELRVDLDPQPGTGFDDARSLALEVLRPVLDELGMVGFPKTSGGRGVHVYVRVRADVGLRRPAPGRDRARRGRASAAPRTG